MKSGKRFEEDESKKNLELNKILKKYRSIKFDDFILTDFNKKIIMSLKNYAENFKEHKDKSILLTGGVGTGKTMIACLVLKIILQDGHSAEIVTTIDMLDKIRESYNPAINAEKSYIDKICNTDFLILDDIGTEKMTEWAYEKFYKVINYRYINEKATFFTSNCDIKQLLDVLGERMVSRIAEMTKKRIFKFSDKDGDWRVKNV
jgi:DNA replication protein DnaC